MVKWEYAGTNVSTKTAEGLLQHCNDMGEKGWELVSSQASVPDAKAMEPEGNMIIFCIWKKQKSLLVGL